MRAFRRLAWVAAVAAVLSFWIADIIAAGAGERDISLRWDRVLCQATITVSVLVGVGALLAWHRHRQRRDGEAARTRDGERLDEIEDGLRNAYRAARWPDPGDLRRQRDVGAVRRLA